MSRNMAFSEGRNLGPVANFQGDRDKRITEHRGHLTRVIGQAARDHGYDYHPLITGMRELGMIGKKNHSISKHVELADMAVNRPDEFRALVHVVKNRGS